MRGIRDHHGRKNSQLLDDCSRFVQSTHMCVTGGEKAVGRNPAWLLLQRPEQHRPCFLKPPGKEVTHADPHQRRRRRITRIETQRCFEMGDRYIGVSRPQSEPPAPLPAVCEARVDLQRPVDQGYGGVNVLTELTKGISSPGKSARVVVTVAKRLLGTLDAFSATCIRVMRPPS